MPRLSATLLCVSSLALSACAVEAPTGPSVAVMPGDGKSLPQFQQDDLTCRQYASQMTGGASPAGAANQSAIGSAVVGTGVGAAAGALIGAAAGNPGVGAAIGAGAGLLTGSAVGAGNAAASAGNVQDRYDIAYQQCMATKNNKPAQAVDATGGPVPVPVYGAPVYPAYPPYAYYPPYPAYYGPAFGPTVVIGGYGRYGYRGRFH